MSQSLVEIFRRVGLASHIDQLTALSKPALNLVTSRVGDEAEIKLGASKFGGQPDLAPGMQWPYWKNRPLAFVGQINLLEAQSCRNLPTLPPNGLLLFFFDGECEAWGFSPEDAGSFAVLYAPQLDALVRTPAPSAERRGMLKHFFAKPTTYVASYEPCQIAFAVTQSLPTRPNGVVMTEEESDAYSALVESNPNNSRHQLLGWPYVVQGDMELECQLVTNGLYCGNSEGFNAPAAKQLEPGAADWRLLLQVDTDDNASMMWGDCGLIYYWIRAQDLAARRFDRSWAILQCY